MQIAELLVEGVVGLPERGRLSLGQGHVVLPADVPLLPLLRALLFFEGDPADGAAALAARPGARAGLALRARDGTIWRVVRVLDGGAVLQRWDGAAGRYETVTATAGELGALLRSRVGLPARSAVEELFSLDGARLAAIAAGPPAAPAATPQAPLLPRQAPALPALQAAVPDGEAAERRIAALEAELAALEKVEVLQRRLDAKMHEFTLAERAGEVVAQAEREVEAARAELERFAALGDLPDDPAPLVEAWRDAGAKRERELERIAAERDRLAARVGAGAPSALWKDWRFLLAFAAGVAAFAGGALTPLRIVALLNVPAFGIAAALGLRWLGRMQAVESASRLGQVLDERERRVEEQWAEATAEVRAAIERAELRGVEELAERLGERARARAALAAAEEALPRVRHEQAPALEKAEALRREVAALEQELGASSAGAWRPRDTVERELAALRAGEAPPPAGLPVPAPGGAFAFEDDPLPGFRDVRPIAAGGPLGFGAAAPAPKAPAPPDPCVRLLEHAAGLLGVPVHEVGGRAAPLVGHVLAATSAGRWREVGLSATGGLRCTGAAGMVPFAALDPADRQLAWIALQLGLVELVAGTQAVPLVWDDPLAGREVELQQHLGPILHALGRKTQVIHRTRLQGIAAHADAIVEAAA